MKKGVEYTGKVETTEFPSTGVLHCEGEKVKVKSEDSPFESYLRAAKNGDADAMFIVGRCYLDGVGTEKDPEEARRWFNKAAAGGNQASKRALNQLRRAEQKK